MKIESGETNYVGILAKILNEQDLTQIKMANDCDIAANTVSRWMTQETTPKIDLFEKVLNKYGYSIVIRKEEKTDREIRKEMRTEAKTLEEKVRLARLMGISYGELETRLRG